MPMGPSATSYGLGGNPVGVLCDAVVDTEGNGEREREVRGSKNGEEGTHQCGRQEKEVVNLGRCGEAKEGNGAGNEELGPNSEDVMLPDAYAQTVGQMLLVVHLLVCQLTQAIFSLAWEATP